MDYDNIDYEDNFTSKKGTSMNSNTISNKSSIQKTPTINSSKVNQFENVKSGGFSGGGMSSKIGGSGTGNKFSSMMDQVYSLSLK